MNISNLIKFLKETLSEHGDLSLSTFHDDIDAVEVGDFEIREKGYLCHLDTDVPKRLVLPGD